MKFQFALAVIASVTSCVPATCFGANLDDPVVPTKTTVRTELDRGHVAAAQCRDLNSVDHQAGHLFDVYAECIDRVLSEAAIDNTLTQPFESAVLFDAFASRATFYDNARRDKGFGKAALNVVRISGEIALEKLSASLSAANLTAAQVCGTTPRDWYDCKVVLKYADAESWKKPGL